MIKLKLTSKQQQNQTKSITANTAAKPTATKAAASETIANKTNTAQISTNSTSTKLIISKPSQQTKTNTKLNNLKLHPKPPSIHSTS
ncbi:hypothetical protein BN7_2927 [Wickerhamomyces ciferrii]|uniref:Uncharacterized protein n=1 Tax=Wickerhamomyces ciferrii (strain ATCC 14091 / BCRC 22168 / CBS 111 / JCM 3599 / NBRC 0793 / NRRL Y-1031 F-60-10) TaxID=1206466 RepID=K0KPQ6_WICCF|nr:uncharacterized protein BN7_2927 [Wickerhamomyces ciferrii]CCH43379.1 hypothetical protein BN7_2927 [Wickerhamomyces ciferrii]